MYLLAFSLMLLASSLTLKAQQTAEAELAVGVSPVEAHTLCLSSNKPGEVAEEAVEERINSLLDERESEFFESFQSAMAGVGYRVMAKVNLEDVICNKELSGDALVQFRKARAKLDRKHVDFVVCSGGTLDIQLVARLDPIPGMRPIQKLMQRRIDSAVSSAGIPILFYPPSAEYDEEKLLEAASKHLSFE